MMWWNGCETFTFSYKNKVDLYFTLNAFTYMTINIKSCNQYLLLQNR